MEAIKKDNYLYKLNKIICIVFCIWFSMPYVNYKFGMYIGMMLTFLWFLTSGYFLFMKKWSLDLFLIAVFFITLLPYVLSGQFRYSTFNVISIIGTFYLFFFGMFLFQYYYFYQKDYRFLGKIALITILSYGIGSIQTYAGLLVYPYASRYLAIGGLSYELKSLYSDIGIGGFNFVYSSAFLLIITFHYFVMSKKTNKTILLILFPILTIILMIIKASYAIAVIIFLMGCVLVFFVKNKKTIYILSALTLVIILIVPQNLISTIFLDLAKIFSNNSVLYEKFMDVSNTLSSNGGQSQLSFRLNLYLTSLDSFLKQPFFGINGPFRNGNELVGGHSGWLDMLAYFGLFVSIPMISAIVFNFKKILKIYKGNRSYIGIYIVQIFFVVFGVINPILYVYQIGLVVFFIAPSVPCIKYLFNGKHIANNNEITGDSSL